MAQLPTLPHPCKGVGVGSAWVPSWCRRGAHSCICGPPPSCAVGLIWSRLRERRRPRLSHRPVGPGGRRVASVRQTEGHSHDAPNLLPTHDLATSTTAARGLRASQMHTERGMTAPNRPERPLRIVGDVPLAPAIRAAMPSHCPACGHPTRQGQTPRCRACDAHMTARDVEASPQHAQRRLARAIERWIREMRKRRRVANSK
jgi:hypothetical protein